MNSIIVTIFTLFSTNGVSVCYTAASVNIQHRLAGWSPLWSEKFSIEKTHSAAAEQQWQINYTIRALIRARASVTTVSHFHHVEQTGSLFTPHPFHTEMFAIILELFSILYRCYYSQNYSSIIISGLTTGLSDSMPTVSMFPFRTECVNGCTIAHVLTLNSNCILQRD